MPACTLLTSTPQAGALGSLGGISVGAAEGDVCVETGEGELCVKTAEGELCADPAPLQALASDAASTTKAHLPRDRLINNRRAAGQARLRSPFRLGTRVPALVVIALALGPRVPAPAAKT